MSKGTRSIRADRTACAVISALALLCVLVFCAGCESLTSTSPVAPAVSETALPPTTQAGAESGAQPTTTVAETTTTYKAPDILLDESDIHRQVRLHVGDRVRVDLPAHPLACQGEVTDVEWTYSTGGIVQQIEAGTSKTDGFVTECWLELEAVAPGQVSVRAIYIHEDTTTRAKWIVYLKVTE